MNKRPNKAVTPNTGGAPGLGGPIRMKPLAAHVRRALFPGLIMGLHVGAALAGPQGGKVVGGSGSIARPNATTTVIRQQSTNLAIDWQKFNVKPNELVQFKQPGRNAQALNRIFDQNASQIHGQLKANGRVLLMNPNGVIFGRTAKVNVNSLVAAGMRNIPVEDFMAGKFRLEALDGADGVVINEGTIEAAAGGDVTFVGQSIRNDGVIIASAGRVNLAAGNKVTLDFDGDGLMRFAVDEAVLENAQALDDQVANAGTIAAEGGDVLIAASAAQDVFTNAINNSGIVKAGRIENTGGQIRLVGLGSTASVLNTGTLDASARDAGSSGGVIDITGANVRQAGLIQVDASKGVGGSVQLAAKDTTTLIDSARVSATGEQGGTVALLGERVGVFDAAVVDVSGASGGGAALIGGDYQGKNPDIRNAKQTVIGSDASILADATVAGDGGRVIVWSDEATTFAGNISAQGGPEGGDGGFVETSGKTYLDARGSVSAAAPQGEGGEWLLDPGDITIQVIVGPPGDDGSDDNGPVAGGVGFNTSVSPHTFASVDDSAQADIDQIIASLEGGTSVTITTGPTGSQDGDIIVAGNISADVTASVTLSLVALNNIVFNAGLSVEDTTAGSGTLVLDLEFGGDGNGAMLDFNDATIDVHTLSITGGANATGTDIVNFNSATIGTGAFSPTVNVNLGSGANEVQLADGVFTNTGAFTITGTTGTDTIVGPNDVNTWTISSTDDADLAGGATVMLVDVETLTGGSMGDTFNIDTTWGGALNGGGGADTFNIADAVTIAGALDGGADADTIDIADYDPTRSPRFTVSSVGSVDVAAVQGSIDYDSATPIVIVSSFDNVEMLIGNDSPDSRITGPDGTTNYWTLNGINDGTLAFATASVDYDDTGSLLGGDGADNFTGVGGTVNGSVDGGGGTNSLTGVATGNAFLVSGPGAGALSGVIPVFSRITVLNGAAGSDSISWAAIVPAVDVIIANVDANGFDGTGLEAGGMPADTFTFNDIETLTGSGVSGTAGDTLTLMQTGAVDADWTISSPVADGGTLVVGGETLAFSSFANLTGDSAVDTFVINDSAVGADLTGNADGAGGDDIFSPAADSEIGGALQGGAGADTFNLAAGLMVTGGIAGGTEADTLVGTASNVQWDISGSGTGTYDQVGLNIGFGGIVNLTGGVGDDAFVFAATGAIAGQIDGAGNGGTGDSADYSLTGNAETVVLVATADTLTAGIKNIELVTGTNGGDDTLVGISGTANTFTITGADTGSVVGVVTTFTDFGNLESGSVGDTFQFNGVDAEITGTITGDATNGGTLDYSLMPAVPVTVNLGDGSATLVAGGMAAGFSNIDAVIGAGGNDTLRGDNTANIFNITNEDDGDIDAGAFTFTDFSFLESGTAGDTFRFNVGSPQVTGTVSGDATNGGTLDYSLIPVNAMVDLGTNAASLVSGGFAGIDAVIGDGSGDSLKGANASSNTFNITNPNTGNVDGAFTFSNFNELQAGTAGDFFSLTDTGSIATVSGNSGSDTISYVNRTAGETITLGVFPGVTIATGIESLAGTDLPDTFTIQPGGQLTGATGIDGGGGADTLVLDENASAEAGAFSITALDTGSATLMGLTTSFSNIQNLTGTANDDTFTFTASASNLSNVLDGGGGTNDVVTYTATGGITVNVSGTTNAVTGVESIVGAPGDSDFFIGNGSVFVINGVDSGTVDGIVFTDWANLSGANASADSFTFTGPGQINGVLDGRTGDDSLDFSTTAISAAAVVLTGAATGTGFDGTAAGFVASFDGIENFTGSNMAGDSLAGLAASDGVWTIDDEAAQASNYAAASRQLDFSQVETLIGGGAKDTFIITNDAFTGGTPSVVSSVNGAAHTPGDGDILDFSAVPNTTNLSWTLSGTGGTVTSFGLAFDGMEGLAGGQGNDTFTDNGTWSLSLDDITTDPITIDGDAGTNEITFVAQSAAVNVNITNLTSIAIIRGGSGSNQLIGTVGPDVFTTAGTDTGDVGGTLSYFGFENLLGHDGADTFHLDHDVTGFIRGDDGAVAAGDGVDTFNIDATLSVGSGISGNGGNDIFSIDDAESGAAIVVTADLFGNAGNDEFRFGSPLTPTPTGASNATLSGLIDGGVGNDTLNYQGSFTSNTVTIDTVPLGISGDSGEFAGSPALLNGLGTDFTDIDDIIDNGKGTLIGPDADTVWTISGFNSGTFQIVGAPTPTGWNNFDILARDGDDTFLFSDSGQVAGGIVGGGGLNTLGSTDSDGAGALFTVTGANDFLILPDSAPMPGVNGGATSLTDIQAVYTSDNIPETINIDTAFNGSVNSGGGTGAVTTGGGAGATLDWNGATSQNVSLNDRGTTLGFMGTTSTITGGFDNVIGLINPAGGEVSLTGPGTLAPPTTVTWTIDGSGAGLDSGTVAVNDRTLTFGEFDGLIGRAAADTFNLSTTHSGSLSGGDGDDIFVFSNAATLFGSIDGGGATLGDTFDLTARLSALIIDANTRRVVGPVTGTFSDFEAFNLNAANNNTVTAGAAASAFVFTVDGADAFRLIAPAFTADFTGVRNVTGGAGDDTFNFAGGTLTGNVDGRGGSSDVLNYRTHGGPVSIALTGLGSVEGFAGTEPGSLIGGTSAFDNIDSIEGSADPGDSLTGLALPSAWNFNTGGASYTAGGRTLTFVALDGTPTAGSQAIESLIGNTDNDTFDFNGNGAITGTITGGTVGNNLLDWQDTDNAVSFVFLGGGTNFGSKGNVAGIIGGTGGPQGYDNIQTLRSDSASTTTFVGQDEATVWVINGLNSFSVDAPSIIGGPLQFDNFAGSLQGGTDTDTFTIASDAGDALSNGAAFLQGGIDGGGGVGVNALVAENGMNTWTITGPRAGTVTGLTSGFTNMDNVTGGNAADAVTLIADPMFTGQIDGGAGANTLTGGNVANVWALTAASDGTVNGLNSYMRFQTLTGGSTTDTFVFNDGATYNRISGAGGTDTFNYAAVSAPVTVNLATSTASLLTAAAPNFDGIEALVGTGTATDLLVGANDTNTWSITGANSGTVDGFAFSQVERVTGGTDIDTFTLNAGGSITGAITGAGGNDTLIGSGFVNNWNLTGNHAGTVSGNPFAQIENLTAVGANATLTQTAAVGLSGTMTANTLTLNTAIINTGANPFNLVGNLASSSAAQTITTGGPLSVSGALNDADSSYTINSAGSTTIGGVVTVAGLNATTNGGNYSSASITAGQTTVTTGGGQYSSGAVNGSAGFNVNTAGGNYASGAVATTGATTINAGTGTVAAGAINAGAATISSGGATVGAVTTTGAQTYVGPIAFSGGLNGGTVSINGSGGAVSVGGTINAASLSMTSGNGSVRAVTTSGNQTYSGPTTFTGNLTGANLVFNGTSTFTGDVLIQSSNDIYDFNSAVLGNGNLDIIPTADTDIFIGNDNGAGNIAANQFAGFQGHLIIGALLNPLDSPAEEAVVVNPPGVTADRIFVNKDFAVGGDVTLIASNINLDASIGAAANTGQVTLVAVGDSQANGGEAPGDITGPVSGTSSISGGKALLIANSTVVNAGNIRLDLNGGDLLLAASANEDEPQFDLSSNATSVDFDPTTLAIIAGLGLQLQSVRVVFSNPASSLTGLQNVQFIDVGLFEEELTLFGVIGNGIAMSLDQCEEAEGCAPNVTDEEIDALIVQIEGRIIEIKSRLAAGTIDADEGAELLAGFERELENFQRYKTQLTEFAEGQDGGGEDDFLELEDFVDEFDEALPENEFAEPFGDEPAVAEPTPAPELEPTEEAFEELDDEIIEPLEIESTDEFEELEEDLEFDFEEPEIEEMPEEFENLEQETDEFEELAQRIDEALILRLTQNMNVNEIRGAVGLASDGSVTWTGDIVLPSFARRY